MKRILFILAALILFITCCEEIEFYSEIPEVSFKEFRYDDSTLVINFVDGDGDLGLSQADTSGSYSPDSLYYRNLFLSYFSYEATEFTEIELKSSPNLRFEQIPTPEGNNKTVKGTIEVNLFSNLPDPLPDSFMIKFYIVDRALHESNRDSSGILTFNELLEE